MYSTDKATNSSRCSLKAVHRLLLLTGIKMARYVSLQNYRFCREAPPLAYLPLLLSSSQSVAILQTGVERVAIWETISRSVYYIDTGLKEPTWLGWSKMGPQLAIGSAKGSLVLYSKDSRRKVPIAAKHAQAILCGDWSRDNKLALGGADNVLTISSPEGDTLEQSDLKYTPRAVQFATQKSDARAPKDASADTTVSVNMGGRTVLLYSLRTGEHPVELAFQSRYGRIVTYTWFGDGYLMLGFSEGYVAAISTHMKEIGEELYSARLHSVGIEDLACSIPAQRAAVAGGNAVRMLDLAGWKEVRGEGAAVEAAHGPIDSLQWTQDGAILTASTVSGHLYAFLAKVPSLVSPYASRVAYMSSLREVQVIDTLDMTASSSSSGPGSGSGVPASQLAPLATIPVSIEPAALSLGPGHVACAMNDRAWYYSLRTGQCVGERAYQGSVRAIVLGRRWAAALLAGRIAVHSLDSCATSAIQYLPSSSSSAGVTCFAAAGDLLYYGTQEGSLHAYNCADGEQVYINVKLDGNATARSLWPNGSGTRLLVLDSLTRVLLCDPLAGSLNQVPDQPDGPIACFWDGIAARTQARGSTFVVSTGSSLHTFVYSPVGLTGPSVAPLGRLNISANGDMSVEPQATGMPQGAVPVLCYDGLVLAYHSTAANGPLVPILLQTHDAIHRSGRVGGGGGGSSGQERARQSFAQKVATLRLHEAWQDAVELHDTPCWLALAGKAMECLDINLAMRVYSHLEDAGMVQSLRLVAGIEDKKAAAGHIAMLFGDYDLAQELFLASSMPRSALDMTCDLLQWEKALRLAATLAPEQVPRLSVELAREAETRGEAKEALASYSSALDKLQAAREHLPGAEYSRIHALAVAGSARCLLRVGDLRRGMSMALDSEDRALCRECAGIMEGLKQFNDAAALYKAAAMWDKAATLYIAGKNFGALSAGGLMDMVSTPKLHTAYARAKEASREYADAYKAYEKARDTLSMVRLLLDALSEPERAAGMVRATCHAEAAALIARYCAKVGDTRGAVEFLLLARRGDEAFELASSTGEMGLYVQGLRRAIAGGQQGEGKGRSGRAGREAATSAAQGRGDDNAQAVSEEDIAKAVLPMEECARVAAWYEGKGQAASAGRLYAECGLHGRALTCFLACGEEGILPAIELAGKQRDDALTSALLAYLLGDSDGVAKDPTHVRALYLAVGNHRAAARTAAMIAQQEQEVGNYRAAHVVLFETVRQLQASRVHVPSDLYSSLVLLHSYTLVRRLVKADAHEGAARMALRVARAITRFPAHVVPILTSTVIECQRAGMRKSAFAYACVLMQPGHRESVEVKYRKKIEALVRRPSEEELQEEATPCPFCEAPTPAYDLACSTCKSGVPFCVLTGRHMVAHDCTACPSCRFPALYTAMEALLARSKAGTTPPGTADQPGGPGAAAAEPAVCPMCAEDISALPLSLMPVPAAVEYLRARVGGEEEREA